jgi:hypothetical protein
MATGDDPLADMQNMMGYAGLVGNNPYSPFQNSIPFYGGPGPGVGYLNGWPTNAMGQPIQAPPGMTLNNTPAAPVPAAMSAGGPNPQQQAWVNQQLGQAVTSGSPNAFSEYQTAQQLVNGPQAAAPAPSPMQTPGMANGAGLNRQQYLQLLANPGALPTYGAAGPQAGQTATGTPPPSVLASFLAANSGKNSSFLNTLRGLSQQPGATR